MVARHPIYLVEVLSFPHASGVPAAVCLLRSPLSDADAQEVARMTGHVATGFLEADDGDLFASDRFTLRGFGPSGPVPFGGASAIAAAKVLFDELGAPGPEVAVRTAEWTLTAAAEGRALVLRVPVGPIAPVPAPASVHERFGGAPAVEAAAAPAADAGRGPVLVRLRRPEALRAVDRSPARRPTAGSLAERTVVVTALGEAPGEAIVRCFTPGAGADEDPGSVEGLALAGRYWCTELDQPEVRLVGEGPWPTRVTVRADPGAPAVRLVGRARIRVRGYLDLPG
ncbi:MAG TPA: PhzF family phenazine biosynthesis protein [Thermoplasmata archaeon]|nr:PhzF family phenazine biosynthesis protein [Thermoplasmata archaeon]